MEASCPPSPPKNPIIAIFFSRADLAASMMFEEFPLVLMATSVSVKLPTASICLEKILSKPKSLPAAVRIDVLVVNAIAGD